MNEREEPMGSTDDPSVLARQSTRHPRRRHLRDVVDHMTSADYDLAVAVRHLELAGDEIYLDEARSVFETALALRQRIEREARGA